MASVAVESLVVVAAGFGISVVWQFHLPLEAKVAVALVVGGMASALLLAAVRPVLWICALLLVFFCLLGALSVGIFFLPAAVALLIAAAGFRPAKSPALKFPLGPACRPRHYITVPAPAGLPLTPPASTFLMAAE